MVEVNFGWENLSLISLRERRSPLLLLGGAMIAVPPLPSRAKRESYLVDTETVLVVGDVEKVLN